ncbi:T9SS type A sorting domain-containing protein [Sanyastnella coralliicola]|uniref:T9SS type A sorting domain-containing protein n=1 Tax=Sanyastnella coralliicola TaxID=3069118 RepID=UPI0027B8DFCA|nr:T9SS type A sorting domain-containing protein [Longitalea sp. SCSIO 12813]
MRLFTFLLLFISVAASAQNITGTEAVEYDPTQNRYIISNGSSILQQASGSDELSFFGDEDADYGMEVIGNKLYTISGGFTQSIKVHDLSTEAELGSTTISGSDFLNGMASDPANNRIWVTDFGANSIYEIDVTDDSNLVINEVVTNTSCTPNGITYDEANNRLVYVCWSGGGVRTVDLADYSTAEITDTGLNQIDGIDHDEDGNFYISSWSPTRITLLANDFTVQETVTTSGLSQPADISYAVQTDTLAIANSGNNTITYLYFGDPVGISEEEAARALTIYPNPVSEASYIQFELDKAANCQLQVIDMNGKVAAILLDEAMPAANHKVSFAGFDLPTGNYLLEATIDGVTTVERFVVR